MSTNSNPSFVLRGVEDLAYEERPIPDVKDHDVLVAVKKTGICGSDVHYLVHGRIGDFVVKSPMVLGHESAGIIAKVGKEVSSHKVGDRVALEPGVFCRLCDACKSNRYELCPNMIFAATPPYDGTLTRYYTLPEDLAYALPAQLTLEDGCMMEPLSVAVHSVSNLGQLRTAQNIVVFGAGPVGLLCMAVAKALGASRIIAVDIVKSRLEFAQSYAATHTFEPPKLEDGEEHIRYAERAAKLMRERLGIEETGPNRVDLVIEASGAAVSIQTGIMIAKVGGRFIQVGMGSPEVVIPVTTMLRKELEFKGSFRYGHGDYAMAISLCAQGKIDLKPLVTHRFAFDDAKAAFAATRAGKGPDGKAVIKAIISGPDVAVSDL